MRRLALFAAVIGTAAAVVPAASSTADDPATTTTQTITTSSAPPKPVYRNGCTRLYSRRFYNRYAEMVYSGQKHVNRHRAYRLVKLARCQHSAAGERWAKRTRRALSAQNRFRRSAFCGSPSCNRVLGMHMAELAYGHGAGYCIDRIVSNESHWRTGIANSSSGAYGIPQALPGSKMRSAGPNWKSDAATQIRWMIGYVRKFGGMCQAWAYWQGHRYY